MDMNRDELQVSSPGRICLVGEHQDYFGLAIIAAAINLRITIRGKRRSDKTLSSTFRTSEKKKSSPATGKLLTRKRGIISRAPSIFTDGRAWS